MCAYIYIYTRSRHCSTPMIKTRQIMVLKSAINVL